MIRTGAIRKTAGLLLFLLGYVACAPAGEIHDAASKGDVAKIAALLQENPKLVDARGESDSTPLHLATLAGNKAAVELLLASKADVNAKDENGETPLHWAAFRGHKDIAGILLSNHARVDSKNDKGTTPLMFAAREDKLDVVELLVANKADINAKDKTDWTASQWADFSGHHEITDFLRKHAAKQ